MTEEEVLEWAKNNEFVKEGGMWDAIKKVRVLDDGAVVYVIANSEGKVIVSGFPTVLVVKDSEILVVRGFGALKVLNNDDIKSMDDAKALRVKDTSIELMRR
jgi:hypothetical protein